MQVLPIDSPQQSASPARFWFGVGTTIATVALIGWGGFVTSIDAGLAVPDWPTSFNSYDPLNPWPEWWTLTPVLAEHGHRLLGALVGILTIVLGLWTWLADKRKGVRALGLSAIALVVIQGVLGGLRVVWVSLDLAVVHACVAPLFLATIASLVLHSSRTWMQMRRQYPGEEPGPLIETRPYPASRIRSMAFATSAAVFVQIILGALLRHPGTGIDPVLVSVHILGASTVFLFAALSYGFVRRAESPPPIRRTGDLLLVLVLVQVALGLTAYLVILDEQGMVMPSNLQVLVNSAHLIVGGLLFATSICLSLLASGAANGVHRVVSQSASSTVMATG